MKPGPMLAGLCAVLSIQCSKVQSEDQRGLASKIAVGQGDAVIDETPNLDSQAVIIDGGEYPPLKVAAEVDVTALPQGFLDDISHISKITPTKTLLYSKNGFSWLLNEENAGALVKLQSVVTAPAGTRMFVQEGQHFWLFGASSIAFPATKQSEELGQVTLLNITPELLKDPEHKVLYVGPNGLILANAGKANIVTREGDKVRSLNLDLPKQNGQPVTVTAAGQGDGQDLFWFLTADQMLLLKRDIRNQWNWRVAKFKVDPGIAGTPGQVAMMVAAQSEKDVSFMGRAFVFNAGKLYEKDALKLSMPDEKAAAIALNFTTNVQPILKNSCAGCHPGYDAQDVAMDKAVAIKTHLTNKTMPPAPNALPDASAKIILDWYASIPL